MSEIDDLKNRVTKLEDTVYSKFDDLNEKLDSELKAIREKLEALNINAAKNQCLKPGECVFLAAKIDNLTKRTENLETTVKELDIFRWKTVGIISAVVVAANLLGPIFEKIFK